MTKIIEKKAYLVEFNYDGDSWSLYLGTIIVSANSKEEAVAKAKVEVMKSHCDRNPGHFTAVCEYENVEAYCNQYPHSNIPVI